MATSAEIYAQAQRINATKAAWQRYFDDTRTCRGANYAEQEQCAWKKLQDKLKAIQSS